MVVDIIFVLMEFKWVKWHEMQEETATVLYFDGNNCHCSFSSRLGSNWDFVLFAVGKILTCFFFLPWFVPVCLLLSIKLEDRDMLHTISLSSLFKWHPTPTLKVDWPACYTTPRMGFSFSHRLEMSIFFLQLFFRGIIFIAFVWAWTCYLCSTAPEPLLDCWVYRYTIPLPLPAIKKKNWYEPLVSWYSQHYLGYYNVPTSFITFVSFRMYMCHWSRSSFWVLMFMFLTADVGKTIHHVQMTHLYRL